MKRIRDFFRSKENGGASATSDGGTPITEPQDLAMEEVENSLQQGRDVLIRETTTWHDQLDALPHGVDFDLRNNQAGTEMSMLERVNAMSDRLGEAIKAKETAAIVQAGIAHLETPIRALSSSRESWAIDPVEEAFISQNEQALDQMDALVAKIERGLRDLSALSAQGAANLDPNAVRRIFKRKRKLGDVIMGQIEDRLAATPSREERKRLQILRDEMRDWMEQRNQRLENESPAVAQITVRAQALQNEAVIQSRRLEKAAELLHGVVRKVDSDKRVIQLAQASPQAAELSVGLRALLLASCVDMAAPLEEG